MSVFRNKITDYFKSRKINILILFFLLALFISVLSKLSKEYTVTVNLQINPVGVPDTYVILPDSTRTIAATVTSHGFNLLSYYFSKQKINLDFSNIEKNESEYLWTKSKGFSSIVNHFNNEVKIETLNPDSLTFRYDVNGVKMIPVRLRSDVTYTPGYDIIDGFELMPDSVKLIGPEIVLDSIHEIYSEMLQLEEVNKDFLVTSKLDLVEKFNGVTVSSNEITVSGIVEKFTEGTIVIPIQVNNVPDGVLLNYYPKALSIFYFTSLNNLNSIDASNFVVECDYSQTSEGSTFLVPKLTKQPNNVKNVRLEINRIEFIRTQ